MNDPVHQRSVQLDSRTADALTASAAASVQQLLADVLSRPAEPPAPAAGEGDAFDEWLDELAGRPAATGASLPADFSRADVYGDGRD